MISWLDHRGSDELGHYLRGVAGLVPPVPQATSREDWYIRSILTLSAGSLVLGPLQSCASPYNDNFMVAERPPGPVGGRWEVRIDGNVPPSGPISHSISRPHDTINVVIRRPSTIRGYVTGLPAGTYQIQVFAGPLASNGIPANLHTGWQEGSWSIEAAEFTAR